MASQVEALLDGLAAAHAIGVVHRDLKPENVLIDRYGRWRITDFGIANATGEDTTSKTGTPEFAAPEQLLGEPHGASVDYFALASIVAYALSGSPPFGDGEAAQIVARQLAQGLDLSPFSPPIADWLKRGLAPRPDDRFQDPVEMKSAWRNAVRAARRREKAVWWRRSTARERT
jgi:serine/threonine-protein kinase